jgi:hypothetical protein
VVGDAVKKYRDMFSFGLLAVAILYLISGVSLLAKSEQDSLLDFPGRAAMNGYLFTHPLLVISLAVAVALAAGLGEASANARGIVITALAIGGISLLLGLVSWLAAFGYEGNGFGGVLTAGKVVSILLGLAQLIALGLTVFFAVVAFQTLPKKAPQAQHWGAPGYGQQQWGQPDASQWGQHAAGSQQWGPPAQQQWGQQPPPQQQWGQQPAPQQWGQQPAPQQQWGQHAQQPAQQWEQPNPVQPEQQYGAQQWGQPSAQADQQAHQWRQQPEQTGWGQQEQEHPQEPPAAQQWGSTETPDVESTTVSESLASHPDLDESADAPVEHDADGAGDDAQDESDEQGSGQQDGWWQRPSS